MRNKGKRPFGIGLSLGLALGFLLGLILVARLGEEAVEAVRPLTERVLRRREGVRFEALLQ